MQVRNAVCRKKGKNTKEGRVTEKKMFKVIRAEECLHVSLSTYGDL